MEDFDMSHKLYGFALSGFTSRILWRIRAFDMCYNVWPNNIDHYLEILIHDQPKYILGMGTYSGVDQDCIRIETTTKNQFRNGIIDKEFPMSKELVIKPFVKQVPQTKFVSALGNSWCNLVSWEIMRLVEDNILKSQYTFLHIPDSFTFRNAIQVIEELLNPHSSKLI